MEPKQPGQPVNRGRTNIELTERILACAFDVHARLGPGMLESAYRACLVHRLKGEGLDVECEVPIPLEFDGALIGTVYRADVIVQDRVLLELKAVERVLSIHLAQLRTYLEHSRLSVGLLLNFNVKSLKEGIRRIDRTAGPFDENASPKLPPTRTSRL